MLEKYSLIVALTLILLFTGVGVAKSQSQGTMSLNMSFKDTKNPYRDFQRFYDLKDYEINFGYNNPICPEENCSSEIVKSKTFLREHVEENQYDVEGTMKVDRGDVKKIYEFETTFQPFEEQKIDGQKVQNVRGTLTIGKQPVSEAEYRYSVNGTLATDGKIKTLSLDGRAL